MSANSDSLELAGGSVIYRGSCHCGAITFEVEAPERLKAYECNCSICAKCGFLHLIVPKHDFRLLSGQDLLSSYSFGTGVAKHLFCGRCGIKSFYVPRSNPDGFSVNVRCLDGVVPERLQIAPFDGKHWEEGGAQLAHLSAPRS